MASNTERLDLLMKDPIVDGSDTFNIETMMNDNWKKIDEMTALIDPLTGKLLPGQENPVDVSDIQQQLTDIENSIGNLPSLETVVKSNLVAAINEVKQAVAAHLADYTSHVGDGEAHGIGKRSNLKTTAKNTIVQSINEIYDTKQKVITISAVAPVNPVDGDIWIEVE